MSDNSQPLHQLYSKYVNQRNIRDKEQGIKALSLWGLIPSNIREASQEARKIRQQYGQPAEPLEELQKLMKKNLRRLGILTDQTSSNIDKLSEGVIEVGQQPNCLGGPSLILNKIGYAKALARSSSASPLFYVADYDGARPELTNTRVPGISPSGLSISYPLASEFEGTSIYKIENPPEEWLTTTLNKIEETYRGLLRGTLDSERYKQNINQAFTIIRLAYFSTNNVSEFSTKIIGTITNLQSDLAIPTYWFSMPETRRLFQHGYELLLTEENRTRFIDAANMAVETIMSLGYKPQIGARQKNYIPFYLECPECKKARVELRYSPVSVQTSKMEGTCPKCKTAHEYSYNPSNPDLSDLVTQLTPRVDSRQIIVDSVIPILAHIVGPSETSYFAEVIPAARALKLPFPIVMRYSRLFYNAPWIEQASKDLAKKDIAATTSEALFHALSKWVTAKKASDAQAVTLAHKEIQLALVSSNRSLQERLNKIESKTRELKESIRTQEDKAPIIKMINENQQKSRQITLYLSWAYGRFNPDKYGQEVNWNWLDLATVTGVDDIMGVYERMYHDDTPNAAMFYVNTR
jgi:uncharacterized protein YllA (UPF0747 family)